MEGLFISAASLMKKAFASKIPDAPRLAAVVGAALLAAACDRPLAQAAMAAESLPPSPPGNARDPPVSKQSAPQPPGATAADPLSDASITARVASAIHGDPALAGTDLTVNTSHGVVSLTGTVRSPEQVAEATARAQAPDGVVRLDTHVSVVPP